MMTLDELAGNWLRPECEEHFALPAITNFHGMVQAAWDVCAVQNWICAPTGMNTPTGLLYYGDGERIRRFPRQGVEYRWKAYEIERRGHGVSSAVRLAPGQSGVMVRLRFERDLHAWLVFGGLPRVWRFTDYWNLPPWDVPQLNVLLDGAGFRLDDVKTFGEAFIHAPGELRVFRDLDAWLAGDAPVTRGRLGVAELRVRADDEITWWATQGCDGLPHVRPESDWEGGRLAWERVWRGAFTPGNADFSGHLPTYEQIVERVRAEGREVEGDLSRLYYMSVLTLLMTRRIIPEPTPRSLVATGGQCIWTPPEAHNVSEQDNAPFADGGAATSGAAASAIGARAQPTARLERAYVWGGPEGAPTTSFLWEVEFQAPLLARLDPAVLRNQLEVMMRVDLRRHWGIETISGAGAGMAYGVNPGAFLSCVRDYVRITGDKAWALRHIDYLRSCLRPELTDYGDCQNILECVSTYEHTLASFNALAVQGLRFFGEVTADRTCEAAAARLAAKVLALFEGGGHDPAARGAWACIQPDGTRRVVKTILDFVYVGRCMTDDLPDDVKRGMVDFLQRELLTEDWLYALAPSDADALTPKLPDFQTYRADHQATGSYDGWPARAASVLLRFGRRDVALPWLLRLQELTREGPFGQAHFIHESHGGTQARRHEGAAAAQRQSPYRPGEEPAAPLAAVNGFPSRTRKSSFFNGNCYFESAGCGFATMILEDL